MNWVGGIKRRILLQEEERRRQDQFFASRTLSVKRKKNECAITTQRNLKPGFAHKRNEDFIYKRIHIGNNNNQERVTINGEKEEQSGTLSRKDVYISRRFKLSSIHGPFSEMLIRMEYQGTKQKLKQKERFEKRTRKYEVFNNANKDNDVKTPSNAMTYDEVTQNSDFSKLKTPRNQGRNNSKFHDSKIDTYRSTSVPKHNTKLNLLEGAPKVRRVISLSPNRFKGRKIWSPIPITDKMKPILNPKNNMSKRRLPEQKSKWNGKKMEKHGQFSVKNNYEAHLIRKLLGSPEPEPPPDNIVSCHCLNDKNESGNCKSDTGHTRQCAQTDSKVTENAVKPNRKHKEKTVVNVAEISSSQAPSKNNLKLSKMKRNLHVIDSGLSALKKRQNLPETSWWTPLFPNIAKSCSDRSSKTTSDGYLGDISLSEIEENPFKIANKSSEDTFQLNKKLTRKNLHVLRKEKIEANVPDISILQDSSRKGNLKLSNMKRDLHVIDSGLPSLKNRKDKTPYLQNLPIASWWTPYLSDVTGNYSDNSSKTPSDRNLGDLSALENEEESPSKVTIHRTHSGFNTTYDTSLTSADDSCGEQDTRISNTQNTEDHTTEIDRNILSPNQNRVTALFQPSPQTDSFSSPPLKIKQNLREITSDEETSGEGRNRMTPSLRSLKLIYKNFTNSHDKNSKCQSLEESANQKSGFHPFYQRTKDSRMKIFFDEVLLSSDDDLSITEEK